MSELLYGRHAVLEALRAGRRQMYRLWLEEKKGAKSDIVVEIEQLAAQQKLPTSVVRR